jgi:hypothetical protein
MSREDKTSPIERHIRCEISPEPADDELLAILQALKLLNVGLAADDKASRPALESLWGDRARHEQMPDRNWLTQVRSWSAKRW